MLLENLRLMVVQLLSPDHAYLPVWYQSVPILLQTFTPGSVKATLTSFYIIPHHEQVKSTLQKGSFAASTVSIFLIHGDKVQVDITTQEEQKARRQRQPESW